ncbi:FMN-binding negative transcriptional regulator [Luteipulveratus flavus]|uniref:FMN-binding negative transcriptional regulator n=1 Tax=Luteipulveratus flavus TaxID=3031728 RepID=A0ABT6CAQ2_9MICO|nr:FMN-binding negative transcriptional regulator [Luteipulveratus sp. YIM 133296]MDF8265965.1 FMN-binding negative transcriptional regulator [Luteipulveratus sp. YIM 133296]
MYLPAHTAVEDRPQIEAFVRQAAVASLVTVGADGAPDATTLPVLWEGDRVIAHIARANPQCERIVDGAAALLVVRGPDGYITPSWYASKAEHGRVVPTWNYTEVQLRGTIHLHEDPEWVLDAVTALTSHHESQRESPWSVTDAPDKYVRTRLRAITGLEVRVTDVRAKAKVSRDKPEADQAGVLAHLPDGPLRRAQETGGLGDPQR